MPSLWRGFPEGATSKCQHIRGQRMRTRAKTNPDQPSLHPSTHRLTTPHEQGSKVSWEVRLGALSLGSPAPALPEGLGCFSKQPFRQRTFPPAGLNHLQGSSPRVCPASPHGTRRSMGPAIQRDRVCRPLLPARPATSSLLLSSQGAAQAGSPLGSSLGG